MKLIMSWGSSATFFYCKEIRAIRCYATNPVESEQLVNV